MGPGRTLVILYDSVDLFGHPVLDFWVRCKEVESPIQRNSHGVVSGEIVDKDIAVYIVLGEASETWAFWAGVC